MAQKRKEPPLAFNAAGAVEESSKPGEYGSM